MNFGFEDKRYDKNEPEEDYYAAEGGDNNYEEEETYDENLGEDFEDTPWVPPSMELAEEYKRKHIYGEARMNFWKLRITHVADLGIGLPLYFQFVKSSAIYFFICTILSIPLLIFAYSGHQIPLQAQDVGGLYQYTFGNIGYNAMTSTYANASACRTPINLSAQSQNHTCIHFFGNEIQSISASYVLTVLEILQVLIFYFIILFLRAKTKTFKIQTERQICSVTDYSIMVKNIAPDTTEEQLVGHFSRLYPLDKPDWLGRPILEDAKPVDNFDNTGDVLYYNTWVAEVNTHRKIGRFVRAFKEQQNLMTQILRARAKMKMYNQDTCHADGPNQKKFLEAEKEMLLAGSKLDHLTEKIASQKKMIIREESNQDMEGGKSVKSGKSARSVKSDHHIVADACAGFVIFQYSESMARCLEDYRHYETFPMSLLTPAALKLRGHTIQVKQAPQPDEMIWENIEVTDFQKKIRRSQSTILTIIILIVSFVAILQAESQSKDFLSHVPPLKACVSDIPAAISGDYTPRGASIARPPQSLRISYDSDCEAVVAGSYYGIFAVDGKFEKPIGNYDVNACTSNRGYDFGGMCPRFESKTFCPCITTEFKESCRTVPCSSNYTGPIDSKKKCYSYSSGLLGGCFCMQELGSIKISAGSTSIADIAAPQCRTFITQYVQSKGVVYLVSIVTVVINTILLTLQVYVTKKESHASIDREQGSLMLKIFLSTYFNLAIVYILVFGTIPGSENISFLEFAHVLRGNYDDFNSEWYGTVGSAFIFAFVLQGLTPILIHLFYYYILAPFIRYYSIPRILAYKSHSIVMQQDLNALLVGEEFDITVSTAQNLALFFFAMTYATALPLLMPISCILLSTSYCTDKLLILRYYRRPPYSGTGVMKIVIECMTYAGIVRLMISAWVFSNPDVFEYESAFEVKETASISSTASASEGYLPSWIESRLKRSNVFPLILMIIVIIAIKMALFLYRLNPLQLISNYTACLFHACRSKKIHNFDGGDKKIKGFDAFEADDDIRQEQAPFSEDYFKYVSDNTAKMKSGHAFYKHMDQQLTDHERLNGWQVRDVGRYTIKQKHWTRVVRDGTNLHNPGDIKKTYEVIADFGCNSYALEKVPAYKLTMIGLKEGTAAMAATSKQPVTTNPSQAENKPVLKKKASILEIYEKAGRQTSIVQAHYERRKSRENMTAEQQKAHDMAKIDVREVEEYRNQSKKKSSRGGLSEAPPSPPSFAEEEVQRTNKNTAEKICVSTDEAVLGHQGSAFGTGLGTSKFLDLSNDADYEMYERMIQDAEEEEDNENYESKDYYDTSKPVH